jgi:transcriptional regulator with XRE-family HTH domain
MGQEPVEYPGLAERIREARKASGLSQRALAERLDTDKSSIWKWEKMGAVPGTHHLEGLERVLGVSRRRLLYGTDDSAARGDPPYPAWREFVDAGGLVGVPQWVADELRKFRPPAGIEPTEGLYRATMQVWLMGVRER